MEKIILHTVRFRQPQTYEFGPDDIGVAVACALDGIYENCFSMEKITDEKGNLILDENGIIDYAYKNGF